MTKSVAIKWDRKKEEWKTYPIWVIDCTLEEYPDEWTSEALTISRYGLRFAAFDHAINYWMIS